MTESGDRVPDWGGGTERSGQGVDHEPARRGVELSVMGLLRVVHRWRALVLALAIGLPVVTAVVTLFIHNYFTARGTILLETDSGVTGLEMLGQLGALTGLPTTAPSADTYLAVLGSRRVRAAVAESLRLADHYRIEAPSEAERLEKTLFALDKHVKLETPDAATIRIEATDNDPEIAARIVNAMLDQLTYAKQTLSLSRAQRTRHMVEEALGETGVELETARVRMSDFQRLYGILSLDEQTTGTIALIGELQQQLLEAYIRRDAMSSVYREGSPEVRQLNNMIAALEGRIAGLVGPLTPAADSGGAVSTTPPGGGSEGFILPLNKVPDLSGEYARLLMNLKVLETKYTVLATKLEQTKVDESQSVPSFEILDWAVRPFRKSGPHRTLFVLTALLGGLLAGVLLAVLHEDLSRHVTPEVQRELASMLPAPMRGRFTR